MNNIAIIPYLSLHVLQIQNVKREVVKKADNTKTEVTEAPIKEQKNEPIKQNEPPSNTRREDTSTLTSNEQPIKETHISDLPI